MPFATAARSAPSGASDVARSCVESCDTPIANADAGARGLLPAEPGPPLAMPARAHAHRPVGCSHASMQRACGLNVPAAVCGALQHTGRAWRRRRARGAAGWPKGAIGFVCEAGALGVSGSHVSACMLVSLFLDTTPERHVRCGLAAELGRIMHCR